MSSYLTVKEGIYNPLKRFAFTNITDTAFTFNWDGKPITVKSGDTVELPHHLAILATGQLVDQIMMEEARQDELEHASTPYYRSPKGIKVGVPEARKPYEDKILKELQVDETSSQFQILKSKVTEELKNDLEAENAKPISKLAVNPEEFASLKKK